jgi:hypothetical protein
MNFEQDIKLYNEHPLTSILLLDILQDYKRPYDKINDLVKKESLIQLRKGLYIAGKDVKFINPEPFLISNHLYNPSYVSIESAFSFWGMIPEKVYEICNCTTKNTKVFKTSIGNFSYIKLPLPYYSLGIEKVRLTNKQTILIASPEKALCDKIITTAGILFRSKKEVIEYLFEDLRMELDTLKDLNHLEITNWLPYCPKKKSIEFLIKMLVEL